MKQNRSILFTPGQVLLSEASISAIFISHGRKEFLLRNRPVLHSLFTRIRVADWINYCIIILINIADLMSEKIIVCVVNCLRKLIYIFLYNCIFIVLFSPGIQKNGRVAGHYPIISLSKSISVSINYSIRINCKTEKYLEGLKE